MSQLNICPECQQELSWDAGLYICEPCQAQYQKHAYCPDCEAELEKLQACGAASYFCNSCNELKSKSRAKIEFHKVN